MCYGRIDSLCNVRIKGARIKDVSVTYPKGKTQGTERGLSCVT